jgi:Flp pilus assembly CpaF family ATPase
VTETIGAPSAAAGVVIDHEAMRARSRAARAQAPLPRVSGRGLEGLYAWLEVSELADLSVWPGVTRVRLVGQPWCDVSALVEDPEECLVMIRHLLRDAGHLGDPSNGAYELALGQARVSIYLDWAPWPVVVVRSHRSRPASLDALVEMGTLPEELAEELVAAFSAGVCMLVSGATGSGKTTFLDALCLAAIGEDEQVCTIEDTYELSLATARPHSVLPFLARPANVEGAGERSMALLTRGALRASPDRVLVGECRGPEALYMLRAMESGAKGSAGTIHSDSAAGALERFCDYILEGGARSVDYVARMVARHIRLVVHLEVHAGAHYVAEVYEVTGAEDGRIHGGSIWVAGEDRVARRTGVAYSPTLARKLGTR